jgi:mevalonate kinase
MKKHIYPSKILLFGEYCILENSSGLSIPYDFYQGTLKFISVLSSNKESIYSNFELKKYFQFLLEKKN